MYASHWKTLVRFYLQDISREIFRIPLRPPAPITRIPDEVLLEIIQLAADDPETPRGTFPTIASQVCTNWRALALATPMLWSVISIDNSRDDQRELEPQLARALTYATRSSSRPILLFIQLRPLSPSPYGAENAAHAIARFLAPHAPRLRGFSLQLMEGFRRSDIRDMLPQTRAPLLETCTVTGSLTAESIDQAWEEIEPPVLPWFGQGAGASEGPIVEDMFPRLSNLSLDCVTVAWSHCVLSNLRSLELRILLDKGRPTWDELRVVLRANAHTLTNLGLHSALPLQDGSEGAPVTLPALTSLSLSNDSTWAIQLFSTVVHIPVLDTLVLRDVGYEEGVQERVAFLTMIAHLPLYGVRRLSLSHITFGPFRHETTTTDPIITAAEGSPELFPRMLFLRLENLHTLALMRPDIATMEALAHAPLGVVPQLARLGIAFVSTGVLEAFLVQRARAGTPLLEELWVEPDDYIGPGMGAGVARRVVTGVITEDGVR